MTMPEKSPTDQEVSLAPQIIYLQPNQEFTYTPFASSTICIFPNQKPVSQSLNGPEIEDQPSLASAQHLALQNSKSTQAFATQTHNSAPRERVVRQKFQQYSPARPFEGDWQFRTYHGMPASITFRTLYDTGCEVNLIPETIVAELGYTDKILKLDDLDLTSLAGTKIECIGEVVIPWIGRKKWFGSKTELVTFLVVPSSNTAITQPIIGADALKAFGILQTTRREGRAFGAARKFENKPKVSNEAASNRLLYAEMRAKNRQLKEETFPSTNRDASTHQTFGKS